MRAAGTHDVEEAGGKLVSRRHQEILDDGHFAPQPRMLECPSHPKILDLVRSHCRDIGPENLHGASSLLQEPADAVERR